MITNRARPHLYLLAFCTLILAKSSAPAAAIPWQPEISGKIDDWNQKSAIEWLSTCGSPKEDWINRVIETSDGSIVAGGYIDRQDDAKEPSDWTAVALKYLATGKLAWASAFGGPGVDAVWAIRETGERNFVLGGFSSGDSASPWDAYLVMLNANGDLLFEKHFGGPGDDRATDVLLTRDGNFLLIGETRRSGEAERDVFLVKTDKDAKELWRKTYGGPQMDRGFAAVETSDGGIVVIGATGTDAKHDGLVFKVDDVGTQLWRTTIPGDKNVTPHFVNLLPSGQICVTGYTDSWGASVNDFFAATLSPDGVVKSLQTLGGKDDDRAMTSVTDRHGGTWIIGYSKSFDAKDWDVLIAQVISDGTFASSIIKLGTPYADNGTTIFEAHNGDLVVGGYSNAVSQGKAPPDLFVMRLDPKKLQRTSKDVAIKTIR